MNTIDPATTSSRRPGLDAAEPVEATPETQPAEDPAEHSGEPVWRVVGTSLAAGLVASVVLTLGVLGGAAEHVISGSALLAFAGGWALLALLSERFTSHHQRWAAVPAVVMGSAGAALLVARPDDAMLDAAGWVWPVPSLVLAAWIAARIRRGYDGRVRWLLYPVAVSVALGAIGGISETALRARDRDAHPAPGALYDVGGHSLHLHCTGAGSPTVVLESGLGGSSPLWSRITAEVDDTTRVCAYDRAGQGWSDDVESPQDAVQIAADLHDLLERAAEPGPYVLVGHSAGGPYVMTYASQYPDEVAGMVLLDAMSPHEFTDLPGFADEQSMMSRGLGVLQSLGRLGAGRMLPASAWSSLDEPAASQVQAFSASARGMRNTRDEQSMYPVVFEQAKALTSLDDRPLVVVTATESVDEHAEWIDLQGRLAALSMNADHRVVDATHAGLLDDRATFAASVVAIEDVVGSVRSRQPVVTR